MRVLTIDTATTASCVGVVIDGRVVAEEAIRAPNAAQHVLAAVEHVLDAAGLGLADVDRIAAGRGPGSFTGLRIGLATALGLAATGRAELAGAGTASALRTSDAVYAVIDARRGEVFAEGPDLPLTACAPDALAGRARPGATLVGDGAVAHRALFGAFHVPADDSPLHLPSAHRLAECAEVGAATALYVRPPDAEPQA